MKKIFSRNASKTTEHQDGDIISKIAAHFLKTHSRSDIVCLCLWGVANIVNPKGCLYNGLLCACVYGCLYLLSERIIRWFRNKFRSLRRPHDQSLPGEEGHDS